MTDLRDSQAHVPISSPISRPDHRRCPHWLSKVPLLGRLLNRPNQADIKILAAQIARMEASMAGTATTLQRLLTALDYDPLTGAHSRLYFMAALRQEVARFSRDSHSSLEKGFTVGMLDIDRFKQFNDRHGHLTGDQALQRVVMEAQRLLRRDGDVFGRYGGEEFAFLLPQTPLRAACELAERLRAALASMLLPEGWDPITVSIGLASCPEHGSSPESLLQMADSALYRAKRTRNATCLAGEV